MKTIVVKETSLCMLIAQVMKRTPSHQLDLFATLLRVNRGNPIHVKKAVEAWNKSLE